MIEESITTKVQREAANSMTKSSDVIATSNICFSNFGKTEKKPKLFATLNAIQKEELPNLVPDGNKTNLTFFVKRPSKIHGPGSLVDDKAPFSEKYGSNCYAYQVIGDSFVRAHSGYICTGGSGGSMTYREGQHVYPVMDEWIIIWTCYATRIDDGLKRNVTYFVTKNTSYLWMNEIALVEYTGQDQDVFSSDRPHGNSIRNEAPHRRQNKVLTDKAVELRNLGVPAKKVYRQLKNVETPSEGISSPKKIYDAYSKQKKKDFGGNFGSTASEQMLTIFRSMQLGPEHLYGDFVKHFALDKRGKPGFICYEDWQIQYTKRCCAFNTTSCSPIHEDKTYSTSSSFLTHYCFISFDFVTAKDPTVNPIIPGKSYNCHLSVHFVKKKTLVQKHF